MSRLLRTGLNAGDSAPMAVVGGEGVYFHLSDGRKLIDGSNTGGDHPEPVVVGQLGEPGRGTTVIEESLDPQEAKEDRDGRQS